MVKTTKTSDTSGCLFSGVLFALKVINTDSCYKGYLMRLLLINPCNPLESTVKSRENRCSVLAL